MIAQATDLEISAKLMLHTKETLNTYMAAFCDQTVDKLRLDTDRDFYMTPQEALSYGIIDEVIQHKNMIKTPKIPSLRVSRTISCRVPYTVVTASIRKIRFKPVFCIAFAKVSWFNCVIYFPSTYCAGTSSSVNLWPRQRRPSPSKQAASGRV